MLRRSIGVLVVLLAVAPAHAKKHKKQAPAPDAEPAAAPAPVEKPTADQPKIDSDLIKQGLQAYDDLDYPRAIDLFQKALAETLTREEKIVVYRALGFIHAAQEDMNAARSDFENLLRIDPSIELDRTVAPRVRAVFEEAKSAVATGRAQQTEEAKLPEVQPSFDPAKPIEGRALAASVALDDRAAEKMRLYHRLRGQEVFSRVESARDEHGKFEAIVPGTQVKGPGLELYIELVDNTGLPVARAGSLIAPLALDVTVPKKPLYKKGWFWGVVGGVVAVGAVVAGVVIATRPTPIGPNTPATLTLQPF